MVQKVSNFTTTRVNLVLNIDDVDVSSFAFQPLNLNSYTYNTSVFAVHNLSDTSHHMSIVLQPESQFSFDYLIYTTGGDGNSGEPNSIQRYGCYPFLWYFDTDSSSLGRRIMRP